MVHRVADIALESFDQRGPICGLLEQPLVSFEDSLAHVDLQSKRCAFITLLYAVGGLSA